VPGPKLTEPVAVGPVVVERRDQTAPSPAFSPGAETDRSARRSPVWSVRVTRSPKRSPFSEPPGTPAVFWVYDVAPSVVRPDAEPYSTVTAPAAEFSPAVPIARSANPSPLMSPRQTSLPKRSLIAKAVANSLAKKVAEVTGQAAGKSFFLNIKGPELLNKYVGETERQIRLVFQRAREKASEGTPVIVFFDEMESLFRTRGSGVSSDVENTIVPQLLAEIDGVEGLQNVVVIGASNREDMIDPAILRPGRLDVKIKIERPDAEAAKDIFGKYLTERLPLHGDDLAEHSGSKASTVQSMIQTAVEQMYAESEENRFLEVTYANGDKEVLYFKDFNSGAMIENIVGRAKKMAIKDFLEHKQKGLRVSHLLQACVDEFKENEDLPNTTNPDDWARISGKKGERIVYIRTLITGKQGADTGRSIDTVANTGQYL
jgi:proteasome-associated ATPase